MKLGERIRELRHARGLTLEALAAAVGSDAGALSRIETGQRDPKMSQVERLAKALGVSVAALLPPTPGKRRVA